MTAIVEVGEASRAEWAVAYAATPARTYFQSPDWADVWVAYLGHRHRAAPLKFGFDDGSFAVVPMIEVQRQTHLHPLLTSSVAGTYGGLLSEHPLSPGHRTQILDELRRRAGMTWIGSPFDPQPPEPTAGQGPSTSAVALEPGSDAVWNGLTKGHRSAVSKARRSGVAIRPAEGVEDWRRYFGLYEQSLARWGRDATTRYGWPLFALLMECAPEVGLWLAEVGGEPVAGAVVVCAGRHVGYWHGAAAEAAFPSRPVHLLIWSLIADAAQQGAAWFDMLPSGGRSGVESFKRSFGAVSLHVPEIRTAAAPEGAIARLRAVVSRSRRSVR